MLRSLLFIAAVLGLSIGGYIAYEFLRSDEDKIRSALAEMAESFNQRSIRRITERFTDDFRDATTKIDKPRLQAYLLHFTRRGTVYTFTFDEDDDEAISIVVDGDTASVEIRGAFVRADGKHDRRGFPLEATLSWIRTEDGWQIERSSHRWARGRPR